MIPSFFVAELLKKRERERLAVLIVSQSVTCGPAAMIV
jgi:hypothetical protein